MGMTWLNNIKALRIGDTEKIMVIYKTGCLNDSEGDNYSILRHQETGKIVFEPQEAMNYIVKQYSPEKCPEILKRKSRKAPSYQGDELIKAFQAALMKKDKFNIVPEWSDDHLKEKYFIISKGITREKGDQKEWYRLEFTPINEDNYQTFIEKIENKEAGYEFNIMKWK